MWRVCGSRVAAEWPHGGGDGVVVVSTRTHRLGALGARVGHDIEELREPLAAVLTAHTQRVAGLADDRDLALLIGEREDLLARGVERLWVVRQIVVAVEADGIHVVV